MAKNKAQIQAELDEAKAELLEADRELMETRQQLTRALLDLVDALAPSDADWNSCECKTCVTIRAVQGLATFNTIDELLVESMK